MPRFKKKKRKDASCPEKTIARKLLHLDLVNTIDSTSRFDIKHITK
jgi:hypothetical protein